MPLDAKQLPRDVTTLQKIVLDLAEQLDRSLTEQNKYQTLLRELLEAQHNRKSEQLSKEQLALFEAAWKAENENAEESGDSDNDLVRRCRTTTHEFARGKEAARPSAVGAPLKTGAHRA